MASAAAIGAATQLRPPRSARTLRIFSSGLDLHLQGIAMARYGLRGKNNRQTVEEGEVDTTEGQKFDDKKRKAAVATTRRVPKK